MFLALLQHENTLLGFAKEGQSCFQCIKSLWTAGEKAGHSIPSGTLILFI